jgi:Fic family protein
MHNGQFSIAEALIEVDKKKNELLHHGVSPEAKLKLNKKFRLEWSYHSNHMEGNTLTYGETQMLLFFGKATGDHEKRQYDEMEAHDVAVKMIEEWAFDKDRDITETDIRQLNQIILVRPYWKEAITADGKATRKQIIPGAYKTSPNSVLLKNGEIHEYASPEATPLLMKSLFEKYSMAIDHPILQAAWFHHELVSIHPFDDGNGRVARLVTNFILLRFGYPPIIIKTENKGEYLTALQKADSGDLEPFVDFLLKELNWTLEISFKAARGQSIDEPGDLDKRIELLKRQLEPKDLSTKAKSISAISEVIKESLIPLFRKFEQKCEKLKDLFIDYDRRIEFEDGGVRQVVGDKTSTYENVIKNWLEGNIVHNQRVINMIDYSFQLKGFKKSLKQQYMSTSLRIQFNEYSYTLKVDNDHLNGRTYSYDENIHQAELEHIVTGMVETILDQISDAGGLKRK